MTENTSQKYKWEVKPFSECFTFYPTNSHPRNRLTYEGGDIRNIHYGDIHKFLPVNTKVSVSNLPYLKHDVVTTKIKSESFCQNGDIVIADTAEDYAGVGKTIEVSGVENEKVVAGLHTYLCRDEKSCFVDGFRGYMMNSPFVHNQIKRYAAGMKVYSITKTNLGKVLLPIPALSEQKRIAEILSAADAAIEEASRAIALSEKEKRGLMQKLIPGNNKEVKDEGRYIKVGEICKLKSGTFISEYVDASEFSIPFVKVSDLNSPENSRIVRKSELYILKDRVRKQYFPIGTVIFPKRGGAIGTNKKRIAGCDMYADSNIMGVIPSEVILSEYLFYYFETLDLGKIANGSTVPQINNLDINPLEIPLPPLSEQKRIAEILKTADEKIALCKERKALLEKTKQGLMQKLLGD